VQTRPGKRGQRPGDDRQPPGRKTGDLGRRSGESRAHDREQRAAHPGQRRRCNGGSGEQVGRHRERGQLAERGDEDRCAGELCGGGDGDGGEGDEDDSSTYELVFATSGERKEAVKNLRAAAKKAGLESPADVGLALARLLAKDRINPADFAAVLQ